MINWTLLRPRNVLVIVAFTVVARLVLATTINALDGRHSASA